MRQLLLIAHTSLDGFVAGPKGELDGFENNEENLEFVCSLTDNADAALFGRVSYELLNGYWPTARLHPKATKVEVLFSNWYNDAKKIVVSGSMRQEGRDNTIILSGNLSTAISNIKEEAGKDILIFGSPSVAQVLMQHDLIDGYWIFVNPVIFGDGIPLFSTGANKSKLKLARSKLFSNGEIALNYNVQRK